MTAFQKQVLMEEERRQQEKMQEQQKGADSPAGPINARHPDVGSNTRRETTRYKNEGDYEPENQATFVDAE